MKNPFSGPKNKNSDIKKQDSRLKNHEIWAKKIGLQKKFDVKKYRFSKKISQKFQKFSEDKLFISPPLETNFSN